MSQVERLLALLNDGYPHSNFEIIEKVYDRNAPSSARYSARLYDLKKKGYTISSWQDETDDKKWWYTLCMEPSAGEAPLVIEVLTQHDRLVELYP